MNNLISIFLIIFSVVSSYHCSDIDFNKKEVVAKEEVKRDSAKKEKKEEKRDDTYEIKEQKEYIAYEVEKREDSSLKKGLTKVIQEGEKGVKILKIKKVYRNAELIEREIVESTIVKQPINKIVLIGSKEEKKVKKKKKEEKQKEEDKWVNITGWGNSDKYFPTMEEAESWAEKTIWEGDKDTNKWFGYGYVVIQTAWKNERTGEIEERGFIVEFKP